MVGNTESKGATFIEAPAVMIEKFAARYNIQPETISAIFCAGVVAMKADGRLDGDATPTLEYVRA